MRKFFFSALVLVTFFSCGDGDLQIETIDFDSISIQYCDDPVASSNNILFKINGDEALILNLQSGALNNGVVGDTITTESAVSSQSTITYRIFSDDVSSDYFCDDIPLATPTVVDEIEAEDGSVFIETIIDADTTNYVHTITLSGISFVTTSGERITNLTIDEFGEVTTTIPN
ncbi:hypothetical protein [Flagellimonas eckloniae]|uniref:Lipoprotein n=1 Tax=Flagellimonas eckloniae TaxID=346185 RepID=A0A0Q0XIN7_9FLAO|nr:hypothetical protein [Allomuricauda eckloniae]KQC28544.1 hypothetical protein AAY42_00485 [Allomuricauda eckloniae]